MCVEYKAFRYKYIYSYNTWLGTFALDIINIFDNLYIILAGFYLIIKIKLYISYDFNIAPIWKHYVY